jgi:hypothetical protein
MRTFGSSEPHIIIVIARGEAVRNFLYSDTLKVLSKNARVTLLSVIHDEEFRKRFEPYAEIVPLDECEEPKWLGYLYHILWHAHYRWLWSEKAKNKWEILAHRAQSLGAKVKFQLWKALMRVLAFRPILRTLTRLYDWAQWRFRQTQQFDRLFERLQPDLVFNTAHIHAPAADLPVRVARRMGIPTAAFIFSWDNLTTRSRITVPYDYYFVWHQQMRDELLSIYPAIDPEQVFVTGTPQFDFHFKPEFWLSREELAEEIGFDPNRPFVLYTTGRYQDFPEEHHHVEVVIRILENADLDPKPQLVVRTYAKGTSSEMEALAGAEIPDVFFPPILWNKEWLMPQYEDLAIYTSLLRHAVMGINAASTVSLELLMQDKPVVNLGFDPPGSQLPYAYRWIRHITFDHYKPVAESGAVEVARSVDEMRRMIIGGLARPETERTARQSFIQRVFGDTLDGRAGERIARRLLTLASPSWGDR